MIKTIGNSIAVTGNSIAVYRMMTIMSGLKFEKIGMKLTRGVSCYAIAKKEFGCKGNLEKVTEQFAVILEKAKANHNPNQED